MICGANYDSYTVALGMFKMLEREFIGAYYTQSRQEQYWYLSR